MQGDSCDENSSASAADGVCHTTSRCKQLSLLQGTLLWVAAGLIWSCDDWGGEAARERMGLPPYGFEGDPQQGRVLYERVCSTCHGPEGTGTDRGPALVHRVYAPSHHPDTAFHLAVARGARQHHWQFGDMPAVVGVTPEQVQHIVAYVRSRQRAADIE